jgi:hypothetical protein
VCRKTRIAGASRSHARTDRLSSGSPDRIIVPSAMCVTYAATKRPPYWAPPQSGLRLVWAGSLVYAGSSVMTARQSMTCTILRLPGSTSTTRSFQ